MNSKKRMFTDLIMDLDSDTQQLPSIMSKLNQLYEDFSLEKAKVQTSTAKRLQVKNSEWKSKFKTLLNGTINLSKMMLPESLNLIGSSIMKVQIFWVLWIEINLPLLNFSQIIELFNNAYNHLFEFDIITPYYKTTMKSHENQEQIFFFYENKYKRAFDEIPLSYDDKILQILDTNFFSPNSKPKRSKFENRSASSKGSKKEEIMNKSEINFNIFSSNLKETTSKILIDNEENFDKSTNEYHINLLSVPAVKEEKRSELNQNESVNYSEIKKLFTETLEGIAEKEEVNDKTECMEIIPNDESIMKNNYYVGQDEGSKKEIEFENILNNNSLFKNEVDKTLELNLTSKNNSSSSNQESIIGNGMTNLIIDSEIKEKKVDCHKNILSPDHKVFDKIEAIQSDKLSNNRLNPFLDNYINQVIDAENSQISDSKQNSNEFSRLNKDSSNLAKNNLELNGSFLSKIFEYNKSEKIQSRDLVDYPQLQEREFIKGNSHGEQIESNKTKNIYQINPQINDQIKAFITALNTNKVTLVDESKFVNCEDQKRLTFKKDLKENINLEKNLYIINESSINVLESKNMDENQKNIKLNLKFDNENTRYCLIQQSPYNNDKSINSQKDVHNYHDVHQKSNIINDEMRSIENNDSNIDEKADDHISIKKSNVKTLMIDDYTSRFNNEFSNAMANDYNININSTLCQKDCITVNTAESETSRDRIIIHTSGLNISETNNSNHNIKNKSYLIENDLPIDGSLSNRLLILEERITKSKSKPSVNSISSGSSHSVYESITDNENNSENKTITKTSREKTDYSYKSAKNSHPLQLNTPRNSILPPRQQAISDKKGK